MSEFENLRNQAIMNKSTLEKETSNTLADYEILIQELRKENPTINVGAKNSLVIVVETPTNYTEVLIKGKWNNIADLFGKVDKEFNSVNNISQDEKRRYSVFVGSDKAKIDLPYAMWRRYVPKRLSK